MKCGFLLRCRQVSLYINRVGYRAYSSAHVIQSSIPYREVPDISLPEYVWKNVKKHSSKTAITCGATGRSYNFGELRHLSQVFGTALVTRFGLKKGDVIGFDLPNIPEFAFLAMGALEVGVIPTSVNPLYTPAEIHHQFGIAEVQLVVTIPQLLSVIQQVNTSAYKDFKGTIVIGAHESKIETNDKVFDLKDVLDSSTELIEMPTIDAGSLAVLPFSSGTTGPPKGVMLTHRNLVASIFNTNNESFAMHARYPDKPITAFNVLPFFHIYGFNAGLNVSLQAGSYTITLPGFTPETYIQCLAKYKPNMLYVVPSLLTFLISHPAVKKEYLEIVEDVVCGAAPVSNSLIDKFCEKAGRDITVRQGYGMTESSPVVTLAPLDIPKSKRGSIGMILPNTKVKIIEVDGDKTCGPNKPGEVLVKGPQIMRGYLKNEEATNQTIDKEGWLHTGDVGYYDEERYLYIIDRTKELIKVKGNQVSPSEIEDIIIKLPAVGDVAVVGIPDKMSGEIPKAFIVLRPNKTISGQDIMEHVAKVVAPFKRLSGGVQFLESIPRNATGKILRHELKKLNKKIK